MRSNPLTPAPGAGRVLDSAHWSADEIDVITRAVMRAPSVHNTQPWRLELPGRDAVLYRRGDLTLREHDPLGRDVSISCGAALANLELAVRVLGYHPRTELLPNPTQAGPVARVATVDGSPADPAELRLYSSIARRRSYRRPFARTPVSPTAVRELIDAPTVDGVQVRHLADGERFALATQLTHAALVLQHNAAYQRELAIWMPQDETGRPGETGTARSAMLGSSLPWAGLVHPATALPDTVTLADRLARETILLVITPDDARADHVRAGLAAERTWLTALDLGLAATLMTQPLQVHEVRAGLIERLELPGYPQLLLRIGHPTDQ